MGPITSVSEDGGRTLRRGRERLFDPVNFAVLGLPLLLLVARHYDMIAQEPLWKIFGALAIALVCSVLFAVRFPPGTSDAKPVLFLALTTGLGGLFLYTLGWGAVLAVTFLAGAAVVIEEDGSRYGRTAMVMTVLTIAVGEAATALGVFPSMISEPTGHGLAVFEAAVTVIVIALLARGQREKERAEEQKRQGEQRFRALVQHTSDAILIIEDGGAVKYASPAVEHLFGCLPEELTCLDMTWIDEDHVEAIAELFRELRSRPGAVQVAEIPIRRTDGTSKWVEVHLTNMIDTPAVGGFICNVRDIGARRNTHLQLVHEAQHDPLTQLANRRLFLERLDGAWRDGATPADVIALLFIDVDNFKGINDRLGHEVGDHVLVAIADALSKLLRPTDLVARFGGDEFTVLLDPMPDLDGALEVAERIRGEVSGPKLIAGHELTLAVSVGVATSLDASDASELLRHSDEAMYSAKRNGRARCESFGTRAARAGSGSGRAPRLRVAFSAPRAIIS